jgi:hypothetical protein
LCKKTIELLKKFCYNLFEDKERQQNLRAAERAKRRLVVLTRQKAKKIFKKCLTSDSICAIIRVQKRKGAVKYERSAEITCVCVVRKKIKKVLDNPQKI